MLASTMAAALGFTFGCHHQLNHRRVTTRARAVGVQFQLYCLACAYNQKYEEINYQKKSVFFITDENSEKSEDNGQEAEENIEDNVTDKVAREAMVGTIGFYKSFISPLLPPACRFTPTCSQYGIQAIEEYGPQKGVILIAWRLLRCSPIGGRGYDPPRWPPVPYTYSSY